MMSGSNFPHPVPDALLQPSSLWFFDVVIPLFGTAAILWALGDSIRCRRLTWSFLFLTNSMIVYWMETVGDWGQHLIYSPRFASHHLLDWLPLKTPYDPVFMPFSYAAYWTIHAFLLLACAQQLVRRYNWSMLKAVIVLAIPLNVTWDLFVEGMATALGWWTYDPGIGPVLEWPNGARITLLWTVGLMCTWPNVIAYWGGKPPVPGLNHIERMCRLERFTTAKQPTKPAPKASARERYDAALNYSVTIARWKFESLRMAAWVVVFNVSFFMMLVLPLVLMRIITDHQSPWIPPAIPFP